MTGSKVILLNPITNSSDYAKQGAEIIPLSDYIIIHLVIKF